MSLKREISFTHLMIICCDNFFLSFLLLSVVCWPKITFENIIRHSSREAVEKKRRNAYTEKERINIFITKNEECWNAYAHKYECFCRARLKYALCVFFLRCFDRLLFVRYVQFCYLVREHFWVFFIAGILSACFSCPVCIQCANE